MTAGGLSEAEITRLHQQAQGETSPFVDPALWRQAQVTLPGVGLEWLSRVVRRPVASYVQLTNLEMTVALQAAQADQAWLEGQAAQRYQERVKASRVAAAAAEHQRAAEHTAWGVLRAALPVQVAVCHNWTVRHLEGYEQGADHIVLQAPLDAGRLHRDTGQTLCWTPARARQLRYVQGAAGDADRTPTCVACLTHARHLAGM
jgi:hypothetical protein